MFPQLTMGDEEMQSTVDEVEASLSPEPFGEHDLFCIRIIFI